jgi:class 3 adenylate cyclase/predicted ATPase
MGAELSTQPPSGTVTLMFTDIVGSTALRDAFVAAHGGSEGNRLYRERLLGPHNDRIGELLREHHGFEVKTIGDSFLIAFADAEDAIRCAVAIQRSLREQPIVADDSGKPLAVRIGMHTGAATLVTRDGKYDYDGDAVNIANRVESLIEGGERIYCSRETAALANAGPGIRYHPYGPYQLKGVVSHRIEIVEVLWHDAMQPVPPKQSHERLPYPWLTPWVGREREMTALDEALRASRLVTLHGTGGVGKTRTAVETLLARGDGLPREIVFVALENVPDKPEGLLAAVRNALGLTEVDAPDLEALCRQLQGTDRLLLLDNFESVMAAADLATRLAATAGVRVLVTSQRALDVHGERVVELRPMPDDESHRLFVDLAQRKDAAWQPDDDAAMREILTATDGLPYLIELVAPVAPKRRLRDLAKELTTIRARHPLTDRHASANACLEWASARLPAEERAALPRLAIFAGGFDAEAALDIAASPLASLDVLVDASLLRFDREAGRYSMLTTTRQFAAELLGQDERTRLAGAHARWFIERLAQANDALRARGGEAQAAAKRWIDAEYDNVQQAIGWAEEQEPTLFRRAVEAYAIYLRQTCRFSEDVRLNEALLRRSSLEGNPKIWAATQNNLGNAYLSLPTGDRRENLARAIACYQAALRVWTERDFPVQWATTQNNLGTAYDDLPSGDRSENLVNAIACYQAALRVRTERDFPAQWATTQFNLGIAYETMTNGEPARQQAIRCFESAARGYAAVGLTDEAEKARQSAAELARDAP